MHGSYNLSERAESECGKTDGRHTLRVVFVIFILDLHLSFHWKRWASRPWPFLIAVTSDQGY